MVQPMPPGFHCFDDTATGSYSSRNSSPGGRESQLPTADTNAEKGQTVELAEAGSQVSRPSPSSAAAKPNIQTAEHPVKAEKYAHMSRARDTTASQAEVASESGETGTAKNLVSDTGVHSLSCLPGTCEICRAPTSHLPFNGELPWLPLDPEKRVHLRLLWGFYTSSLPISCSAMQDALIQGDLSALRAEAALLSIISRALGFTCLSLSAKRVAEICDMRDTGSLNPAWGPHHPVGAEECCEIHSHPAQPTQQLLQRQQPQQQEQLDAPQRRDFSASSNTSCKSLPRKLEPFDEGSSCGFQRTFGPIGAGHDNGTERDAGAQTEAETVVGAPAADIIHAIGPEATKFFLHGKDCNKQGLPSRGAAAALLPRQRLQGRHMQQKHAKHQRHQQMERKLLEQHDAGYHRQAQKQQQGPLTGEQQPSGRQQHQQIRYPRNQKPSTQQKQLQHHRNNMQLAGMGNCKDTLCKAVAVCFLEVHAAKSRLDPLFQENMHVSEATSSYDEAALRSPSSPTAQDNDLKVPWSLPRDLLTVESRPRTVLAAAASRIDAKITVITLPPSPITVVQTASKKVLKFVRAWSGATAHTAASVATCGTAITTAIWRQFSPSSGIWSWLVRTPLRLFSEVSGAGVSPLVATVEAKPAAAAQGSCKGAFQRAVVLLNQRCGSPAISYGPLKGNSWLSNFLLPGEPKLIKHLLHGVLGKAEGAARRKGASLLSLVKRLLLPVGATLQTVHKLLEIAILWKASGFGGIQLPGFSVLWSGTSPEFNRNCTDNSCSQVDEWGGNSRTCNLSSWVNSEGLRQKNASSTWHWSSLGNIPDMCSYHNLLNSHLSDWSLPFAQLKQQQQQHVADLQLPHQTMQVGQFCRFVGEMTPISSTAVSFHTPVAYPEVLTDSRTSRSVAEKDGSSTAVASGPRRNISFGRNSQTSAAKKVAVAGAAAAAATASWGAAASSPRLMTCCQPQRHVSFQTS